MAIQISGTTVIDNSRNLDNIAQVNVSGVSTFGGNVNLGDNDVLYLGDSNDLEIYHDGSNSYVKDSGTGALRLWGSQIQIKGSNGEDCAIFRTDGATDLFYDNATKLVTTSTGINVTGSVTCDGLTVEGDQLLIDGNPKVTLKDSNNSGNGAVTLVEFMDSADTVQGQIGYLTGSNQNLIISNRTSVGSVVITTNNTDRIILTDSGHLIPATDSSYNIGSNTERFANVYADTYYGDGSNLTNAGASAAKSVALSWILN